MLLTLNVSPFELLVQLVVTQHHEALPAPPAISGGEDLGTFAVSLPVTGDGQVAT